MAVKLKSPRMQRGKDALLRQVAQVTEDATTDAIESALDEQDARQQPNANATVADVLEQNSTNNTSALASRESGTDAARTFGRAALALAATGSNQQAAADFAAQAWGEGSAPHMTIISTVEVDGGAAIADGTSTQMVELLENTTVMRRLGGQRVPMPSGQLRMTKETSQVTASYVGETKPIPVSGFKLGHLSASSKKLGVFVPVSNDWIKRVRANPSAAALAQAESWIQRRSIHQMALREDLAFLRDIGGEFVPRGVGRRFAAGHRIPANAVINFSNILADLGRLVEMLMSKNIPMSDLAWIFSPRTFAFLSFNVITDGLPYFLAQLAAGNLLGWKFGMTNQVPNNLGAGTDASEIYLIDMDQVLIFDEYGPTPKAFDQASYTDGNAVMKSAAQNDETVIRVTSSADVGLMYDEAGAVLEDVLWKS